jgi:uncharacterized protein
VGPGGSLAIMDVYGKVLVWRRHDAPGMESAVYDDGRGLAARGRAISAEAVPYMATYGLRTDADWRTAELKVTVEGGGWWRNVRLTRTADGWDVHTATRGRIAPPLPGLDDPSILVDAVDVDLAYSPLTNTLPVRRLGLLGAPAGTERTIVAAWVSLPELAVYRSEQTYTVLGDGLVRYTSGDFTADISIDAAGYVVDYPGLAIRSGTTR